MRKQMLSDPQSWICMSAKRSGGMVDRASFAHVQMPFEEVVELCIEVSD